MEEVTMSKHNREYKNYNQSNKLKSGLTKSQEVNEQTVEGLTTEKKIEAQNSVVASAAEEKVIGDDSLVTTEIGEAKVESTKPSHVVTKRTSHNIYLRSKMDTHHSTKICVIKKGALIDIVDTPNDKWHQVETEFGKKGYVMSKFTEEPV